MKCPFCQRDLNDWHYLEAVEGERTPHVGCAGGHLFRVRGKPGGGIIITELRARDDGMFREGQSFAVYDPKTFDACLDVRNPERCRPRRFFST
jgi:hypothetical protein